MRNQFLILLVLALIISCRSKQDDHEIKIVSWGGQFQNDLMHDWLRPAAQKAHVAIREGTWNGDYSALTSKILKDLNAWDLVHVEDYYINVENREQIFEKIPDDIFVNINPRYKNPFAVPLLEYGYILAIRSDNPVLKNVKDSLQWKDFWDTRSYPGIRCVRDFPLGNMEIALTAMGYDVKTYLYDPSLTRSDLEKRVDAAIEKFQQLGKNIVWYTTGDQLQKSMETGEATFCAAWSGRAASAYKVLCGEKLDNNCKKLAIFPGTAFISVDWWVVPKNSTRKVEVFSLLKSAYDSQILDTARTFAIEQGYGLPLLENNYGDALASYFLDAGSFRNKNALAKLDEQFWSRNFSWIDKRWQDWRFKK